MAISRNLYLTTALKAKLSYMN